MVVSLMVVCKPELLIAVSTVVDKNIHQPSRRPRLEHMQQAIHYDIKMTSARVVVLVKVV
jgi:hypothetical protein